MKVDYALVNQLRARVAERLNDDTSARAGLTEADAVEYSRVLIDEELRSFAASEAAADRPLLGAVEEREYAKAVHDALFGLGPLQRLVDDSTIENININGCDEVWVKYASTPGAFAKGRQRWPERVADSDAHLEELIRHAATYLGGSGRSFNRSQPQLDMQLPGGHRLSAVMSVSPRPVISIRRHTILDPERARLTTLERLRAIDEPLRLFLAAAVRARLTIVIAGGTNAGKTTLLRALANEIPPDERLITIEKARELGLDQYTYLHPDCVALETREANTEGGGAVDMRQLVRRGLRMDPDRVIVGEVLGDEVIDMLNAMSQGNDGSMCTIHANSSDGVFRRIATYAIQAPERLDFATTSALIGGAVDLIVFISQRTERGRLQRRVSSIREVAESGDAGSSGEILGTPSKDADQITPIRRPRRWSELVAHGAPENLFDGWRVDHGMLRILIPAFVMVVGVGILVAGLPSRNDVSASVRRYRSSDLAVATLVGGAGFLLTQWWAGALLAFVAGLFIPYLLRRKREVERAIKKTEAVASWIESVRDTLVTGDMKDAIIASSEVAPQAIRPELRLLQARLGRKEPLGESLRQFARDLDDATGDLAVAALALAYERQGQNLRAVLALMSQSARQEAQMQRRVQAGRARLQTVATIVTIFSLIVLVLLVQLNPQAVAAYNKTSGQIALLLIGMVFAGGLLMLVRMGEVRKIPRFLSRG